MEKYFEIQARGSSWKLEFLGGITTFVSMAYILVVNPAILSFAGIPIGASTVATALVAAIGSILMGLYANRPIAVAPYMGENAFLAFGLAALGIGWQQRLGAVFVSGCLFLILTLIGLRGWLAQGISASQKHSFAAGIGLFLAFIGLYECGIVTSSISGMPIKAYLLPGTELLRNPEVPVRLGALHDSRVLLSIGTFLMMILLLQHRVPGALLLGMVVSGIVGLWSGLASWNGDWFSIPFQGQYSLDGVLFALDLRGVFEWSFVPVLMTLVLMCFLDTLGTLVGLGAIAGWLDKEGNFCDVKKPMVVDAMSNIMASVVGTSTSGAYLESAAGIREGARTGVAAIITGGLFAAALLVLPLVGLFQTMTFAYGPVLVVVGALMIAEIRRVNFEDLTEGVPAFVTMSMMVFTYNIGNGLTAGLAIYPFIKLASGRWREVSPGGWILSLPCVAYYVFGLKH